MSIATERAKRIFAENLVYYLEKKDITRTELAEHLGVTKGAVSQWCSGYRSPSAQMATRIAEYLRIELDELTKDRNAKKPNAEFTPFVQVPLYDSISAGLGTTRQEPIGTHPVVVHNREEAESTLCVTVDGDSMSPKIESGDIIQIRQQRSVDSGDIAAVLLDDADYFVKRVEYGADWIRLVSLNPNYPPIVLSGADVQRCFVLGKVVSITKRC